MQYIHQVWQQNLRTVERLSAWTTAARCVIMMFRSKSRNYCSSAAFSDFFGFHNALYEYSLHTYIHRVQKKSGIFCF